MGSSSIFSVNESCAHTGASDTGVPENVSLANVEVTHTSRLELKDHEDLPDVERTLQEQRLGEGHRYESSSHTKTRYRHLSLVFHSEYHLVGNTNVSCVFLESEVESTYNSTIATRNAAANASEIDERLRHCTSEYLAAQFNEGNNILCTIPITWDREDQESYIPDHLYFLGMTTPILLLIKIGRTWPMLPGRISTQEIDQLLGSPRDRGRLSGSTSLSSKVHLRPLWTYINASTTLIPNSLAVQGDKGQIDFVTWKDWRGTNLEMTNFKHLDWEYDSILNFDERLKTATVLRVFDQKDKQELSLTSTYFDTKIYTIAADLLTYRHHEEQVQNLSLSRFQWTRNLLQWQIDYGVPRQEEQDHQREIIRRVVYHRRYRS